MFDVSFRWSFHLFQTTTTWLQILTFHSNFQIALKFTSKQTNLNLNLKYRKGKTAFESYCHSKSVSLLNSKCSSPKSFDLPAWFWHIKIIIVFVFFLKSCWCSTWTSVMISSLLLTWLVNFSGSQGSCLLLFPWMFLAENRCANVWFYVSMDFIKIKKRVKTEVYIPKCFDVAGYRFSC